MNALDGLRVIDMTGEEGAYAGRLLGDLGAEVIRVIGPTGDPLERVPPLARAEEGELSLAYEHFLTNRRSVRLDPSSGHGVSSLRDLLRGADVFIEGLQADAMQAWGLDHGAVHAWSPGLVHVSITPYGRFGPLASAPGTELTAAAAGGLLYLIGEPDRAPVQQGGEQLFHLGSMYAAAAALAGVRRVRRGGAGGCVDLSLQEAAYSITGDRQLAIVQTLTAEPPRRTGNQTPHFFPYRNFECRDGWVTVCALEPGQWEALSSWVFEATGDERVLDPRYAGRGYDRVQHVDELLPLLQAFCSALDKQTLYREGQARGIPIMPANSVADLLTDPQLTSRQFFAASGLSNGHTVLASGRPYRLSGAGRSAAAAPRPGVDRVETLARREAPIARDPDSKRPPLEGLRVLEVGWYVAAPWLGLQMAHQGAEVIKVETAKSVDIMRRVPIIDGVPTGADYASFGGGKRSITLDLRTPKGRSLLGRLVAVSDVVTENFSLEAGRRFGLGWETVSAANPRAVLLRMPGLGLEGPASEYVSYGMAMSALSGHDLITGYEDGPPGGNSISYPDYVAALHGLVAVLGALELRDRTGRGLLIELAQFESSVAALGPAFLDYQLNGRLPERLGNGHAVFVPQGVYPAKGDDRWFALSVRTDDEWTALASVIGSPLTDQALSRATARRAAKRKIDEVITGWGRGRSVEDAVRVLREAAIPASVVATSADVLADRHLRERGFFVDLEVPRYGSLPFARSPISFDGATGGPARAHDLGEDNEYVFRGLLGLDPEEYRTAIEEGVIS